MKNKILIHKNNSTLIIIVFPKFRKAFVLISEFKLNNEMYASIYLSHESLLIS